MFRTLSPSLFLAFALSAQAPVMQGVPTEALQRAQAAITDWLAPIHKEAGAAGTEWWAAGRDFKVSFHGGFDFHPLVGGDSDPMPFSWRTVDLTAGGSSLLTEGEVQRHTHTDWRYEYVSGRFKESYDVQKNGVEQSFTIFARPARGGDIVVTGLQVRFRY